MSVLDLGDAPILEGLIPAGVSTNVFLGTPPQASATPVDFEHGTLLDVSAWESWKLAGKVNLTAGNQAPRVILTWYTNTPVPTTAAVQHRVIQSIQLPTTAVGFMVLGRVLGPLVSVQFTGTLDADAGIGNMVDFFVSNRTRLHDAPYTPASLGVVLASIGQANIGSLGSTVAPLPYYLGPAVLNGYFGNATTGAAHVRVRDTQAAPGLLTIGQVTPVFPTTELWIPNLAQNANATTWELEAENLTAGTVLFAGSLVAA